MREAELVARMGEDAKFLYAIWSKENKAAFLAGYVAGRDDEMVEAKRE